MHQNDELHQKVKNVLIYMTIIYIFSVIDSHLSIILEFILNDVRADMYKKKLPNEVIPFVVFIFITCFITTIATNIFMICLPHIIMLNKCGIEETRKLMLIVVILETIIMYSIVQPIFIIQIMICNCVIYYNLERLQKNIPASTFRKILLIFVSF